MFNLRFFTIFIIFFNININSFNIESGVSEIFRLKDNNKNFCAYLVEKRLPNHGCISNDLYRAKYLISISEKNLGELFFEIHETSSIYGYHPDCVTIAHFFKMSDGFCICGFIGYIFIKVYIIKFDNNFNKVYSRNIDLKEYNIDFQDTVSIQLIQTNLDKFLSEELKGKLLPDLINIVADYAPVHCGIRICTNKGFAIDYMV